MNYICNILFVIALTFILIREYKIIQSFHYEFDKYLYYLKYHRKAYLYFLYCLLGVFVIRLKILYLFLTLGLLGYLVRDYQLKYTPRVKRVFVINGIILFVMFITNTLQYVFIVPFLYLALVHYISLLVEEIIFIKYLKKAKSKIKDKLVIGITGSAGKTSIKNIVYDLMINKFNVSKTPHSYNNRVGITKSINEVVNKYDDYFVCEYGVDRVGGMERLLKIVKPNIAVISEIGNQHLLSFKSVDNILKEKLKLIESLDSKGIAIINNDNRYLNEYCYKNKNVLRYGIDNDSDIMAKNLKLNCYGSEFDLYIKGKFIKRVKIELLSRHSVENVLAGICVCLSTSMSIEEILSNLKNISITPHRLEKKVIGGTMVIDDGFNSNVKGFKEALELLKTSKEYKVLITPGIIEQGSNNSELSKELAKEIAKSSDFVYLVSDNSKSLIAALEELEFSNFEYKESFKEAFECAKDLRCHKIILIENDLPDIYLK